MADKSTKSENESSSESTKLDKKLAVRNKRIKKLYIIIAILAGLLVAGGGVGYWQYSTLKNENKRLSNPEEAAKIETDRLKKEIAKLVDVPSDEEPTIATVTDIEKLKGQPFFAKAQNGDKVFMYAKAKKAILYRPSTNKVVELAPINSEATPDKQEGVQPSAAGTNKQAPNTEALQPDVSSQVAPGTGESDESSR